ncbi:MAG: SDR family NAD(P)-dependent oxidoreductase [Janthinobacterium lividum]
MNQDAATAHLATPRYDQLLRLDGQVFVVFGAGQGIGREVAHALSQLGAKVVCSGRGQAATQAVADEVGGVALMGDATVRADVERIFAEAEARCGKINGFVDILGEPWVAKLATMTDENWDWQFDIGLRHAFLSAQIGLPKIAAQGGGSAVYVSSIASMGAVQKQVAYGAAKAALEQFVKGVAVEYGHEGIRVNAVVPGVIQTPRVLGKFTPEIMRQLCEATPLRKVGVPADIAGAVLYLCSALSAHVSGHCLVVDGGITARSPLYGVGRRKAP